jgi:hypothetical protein
MDAALDTIVAVVTTDPNTGCGLPAAMLGDLTAARAYTLASSLYFSPALR